MLSLDEIHTSLITECAKKEATIPELENRYKTVKRSLKSKMSTEDINLLLEEKQAIKNEIKKIKNHRTKYILENSRDIFGYFEEKQNINKIKNNQTVNSELYTFFKIKPTDICLSNAPKQKYKTYWKNVMADNMDVSKLLYSMDMCCFCGQGEFITQEDEGVVICNNNKCGKTLVYVSENTKQGNMDAPTEGTYTSYIPLNHFKEILSQFQSKQTTNIPDDVINKIKTRIKKDRILVEDLNGQIMREILRKLSLTKYFDHTNYINSLFGVPPIILPTRLTEKLCELFVEIQPYWTTYCPKDRINFFNYTYVLYQLFRLLGKDQYLEHMQLLKDREKAIEADSIWKLICRDKGWYFYPTV